MSAERDPIEELLATVSDGAQVDWDAAVRGAPPRDRARVEALREVARIADFNRSLQREGATGVRGDVPERWGDLALFERIGSGAHAEVFRAWDAKLQRDVAVKLLRAASPDAALPADALLLEEGRALARIRHPNVVTVHGIDRHEGRVGLWMELVRGTTLEHEVLQRGPLELADVGRLGTEIGSALAAVHAAGLLHRDVKPANVVRDAEGRFVLADFGLGLRWDEASQTTRPSGTPMYMAPELLAGSAPSARSDVYSLGMLMWFALAGRHPFDIATLDELRAAAKRGPRPALREVRPDVPAGFAAVVERAIAPDPAARFAGAQAGSLASGAGAGAAIADGVDGGHGGPGGGRGLVGTAWPRASGVRGPATPDRRRDLRGVGVVLAPQRRRLGAPGER
jgi:tRNA A-37 threonylcarbamoyl transferase component Bud32